MAHLYGVYRAKVVNSLDPLQAGRLLISIPALAGISSSWAPSCVATGAQAGQTSYRPNDDVLVAFERGDANFPIVIGKLG